MESSSDEDISADKTLYLGQSSHMGRFQNTSKLKMNPVDKFGHVRGCTFCKCTYHWIAECPYVPSSIKNEVINKTRYKNIQKTLWLSDFNGESCEVSLFTDSDAQQFCYLVGETFGKAVVDTGCPYTVAGKTWFQTHLNSLSRKDKLSIRTYKSDNKFRFANHYND